MYCRDTDNSYHHNKSTVQVYVLIKHKTEKCTVKPDIPNIIIIISGFGIYGAAVVPDSGVGNTWKRLTLVLHEFLSNGLTPSRLHIVISFLAHADHVFLGLPRFLVPGTPNRVMELMQESVIIIFRYNSLVRQQAPSSGSMASLTQPAPATNKADVVRFEMENAESRVQLCKVCCLLRHLCITFIDIYTFETLCLCFQVHQANPSSTIHFTTRD